MKNLSVEALITLLGHSTNKGTKDKVEKVVANTKGFEQIKKHIVHLNDALKAHKSYITLSNTYDYFKIKTKASSPEIVKNTHHIIHQWAQKYKIEIKKVLNKDTYYIIGQQAKPLYISK